MYARCLPGDAEWHVMCICPLHCFGSLQKSSVHVTSDADLAGLSVMLKVTEEAAGGRASRSAGAYMQNLGSRSCDSNT